MGIRINPGDLKKMAQYAGNLSLRLQRRITQRQLCQYHKGVLHHIRVFYSMLYGPVCWEGFAFPSFRGYLSHRCWEDVKRDKYEERC